jgi:phosphopantetheinyl transferase (holo-ACP synthase)
MGKSGNLRFINRVFTHNEKKLIFKSANPNAVLWALWAGKETAYKIVKKTHPTAPGVPSFYEVRMVLEEGHDATEVTSANEPISSIVDTPCGRIHCRYFITRDYVHCIGSVDLPEVLDSIIWQVSRINPVSMMSQHYESICVRDALKRHLSVYLDESPEDIDTRRVKDSNGLGPPFVYVNDRKTNIDVSLSHDGRFAAYAFIPNGGVCLSEIEPQSD